MGQVSQWGTVLRNAKGGMLKPRVAPKPLNVTTTGCTCSCSPSVNHRWLCSLFLQESYILTVLSSQYPLSVTTQFLWCMSNAAPCILKLLVALVKFTGKKETCLHKIVEFTVRTAFSHTGNNPVSIAYLDLWHSHIRKLNHHFKERMQEPFSIHIKIRCYAVMSSSQWACQ